MSGQIGYVLKLKTGTKNNYTTKCKFDAISLVSIHDSEGVAFENLKPVVIKNN